MYSFRNIFGVMALTSGLLLSVRGKLNLADCRRSNGEGSGDVVAVSSDLTGYLASCIEGWLSF
jgi:hypothetical protein